MFVYLLKFGDTTVYKIGMTNDFYGKKGSNGKKGSRGRLQTINSKQVPYESKEIHKIEVINAMPIEKTLHHKYEDYRFRGEWFELTDEQVENVIQDMNFLQFNEQILYKTDYSNIPVKSADIDLIQNNLETYLKNGRHNKGQLSLDKQFKLVQLALLKGCISTNHLLDFGIKFFLEEDYELALVYFDAMIVFKGKNTGIAYFWKAETLFHKLKIQSRKESNDQCDTDSEYQQDIKLIHNCYTSALAIFDYISSTIPSLKNRLNLARIYHALGLFLHDYMDYTGTTGFSEAIHIYNKFNCINTRNIVVRDANTRVKNAEYDATQIYHLDLED
ncbi:GIY-YIG nuclease family protein [Anabaena sp. UHCC 0204]|uniref:GIY-YIG nuclease family protein n=1 Tax=Anabaena sp. UHCC 0204 TaxID=2590009 RepID=UPI0014488704|nr:GIY-YIG nuclease family protein [Anabaena sp. UHCC 0204]MTJ10551.1 GIY-YIG nuclease family protein [Anabaena sp. UHCC 0204]